MATGGIRFGRYRLHPTQGLTRGRQDIRVTPKSLAVLRVLLEHSGAIVTRDELFRAAWPDAVVSDAALTTCIQELRRALADDARRPKYIETVHRRGFRFLGSSLDDEPSFERAPEPTSRASGPIVGREAVLQQLAHALSAARDGRRQVVLMSGEAGIGKTAVLDLFFSTTDSVSACRVARADCVEHRGAGEAYQPLLEALSRLCTRSDGESCLSALRRCAPTWLAQLPALQTPAERLALRRRTAGAMPERMLRELTDAIEAMTTRSALVLCLDDLHWSDVSTLDWVASFARRPETARVLVIGTYRSGEPTGTSRSPEVLANELLIKGECTHIALGRLGARDVSAYVHGRFPPAPGAGPSVEALATLMYQRTEGNPLFLVNAMDDLVARGALVSSDSRWSATDDLSAIARAIPVNVERAIERQIERLREDERRLLEVASIVGATCPAAAVAAAAAVSVSEAEATLGALARRGVFVRECPPLEWPDGTLSATFEFQHALYREVLSAGISAGRRQELHRVIATRLEAAYGTRASAIAAELAVHFEHARDNRRAVVYFQQAAETARSRSALDVALDHYQRALAQLEKLPVPEERDAHEVGLRIGLGNVLMQTRGWGAPEVQAAYGRVRELTEASGTGESLLSALWNLWIFSITRGDLIEAQSFADRLFEEARRSGKPEALLQAHHARWSTLFALGDLHGTETHTREGLQLCHAGVGASLAYGGHDAGVCARAFCARALALGGSTETAAAMSDEAVRLARTLDHPFTIAFALMHGSAVHEILGDAAAVRAHAAEATQVAHDHSFGLILGWARCFLGWSMVELGETNDGLAMISAGTASAAATGSVLFQPHMLGLLAHAQTVNGLLADARRSLAEALAISERTGDRFYLAELYRLRGELRLACADDENARRLAEDDFKMSLEVAEVQGAHALTVRTRASTHRSRL